MLIRTHQNSLQVITSPKGAAISLLLGIASTLRFSHIINDRLFITFVVIKSMRALVARALATYGLSIP